jgi:hypothetical protein
MLTLPRYQLNSGRGGGGSTLYAGTARIFLINNKELLKTTDFLIYRITLDGLCFLLQFMFLLLYWFTYVK